jgi:TolB-like protein/Tfp pilus assembly protein PilF
MGFIAELKRRNVIRMAGLYLVAAWLITQVAGTVLPMFDAPSWLPRSVVIVLAIGFLPALVFAWIFELTPDGLKRDSDLDASLSTSTKMATRMNQLIIAILLLALVYFAIDKFIIGRSVNATREAAVAATLKATKAKKEPPSIAVLPFDNRSALPEDVFFVDGMHDDILTQLSKISGLKVISRTSVESFRDTKLSMREIAQRLGVKTILEGAVQRGGNRVRINMQLIDAETDGHLWAETYDRELNAENIFAIQSEVTAAITGSLQAQLTDGEKAGLADIPTKSLAAWEAFQLGKQRRGKRTSSSLEEAERYFNKAIALEPGFTLAKVLLADTYISQIWYSGKDLKMQLDKASAIIEPVRAAHPDMPEALSSAGTIAIYRQDTKTGERLLRLALSLRPNYVPAMHVLADYLPGVGKHDEAIRMIDRAIVIDPLSSVLYGKRAAILEDMGRFESAKTSYLKSMEIDPDSPTGPAGLANLDAYVFRKLDSGLTEASKAADLDPGNPLYLNLLTVINQDIGLSGKSIETAKRLYTKYGQEYSCTLSFAELFAGNAKESQRLSQQVPMYSCGIFWLIRNGRHQESIKLTRQEAPELFDENATPTLYQTVNKYPVLVSLNALGRESEAKAMAERMLASLKPTVRLGLYGYGLTDVALLAQMGRHEQALATLEDAVAAGWQGPYWQFMRDFDPALEPIRSDPRFRAAFARLESSVTVQRARFEAKPPPVP